jgi:hypothetical protein
MIFEINQIEEIKQFGVKQYTFDRDKITKDCTLSK